MASFLPASHPHWGDRLLMALSAFLGAAGVTLAAAEAHIAPGSGLQSAAYLSLVSAPACLALLACGASGLLTRGNARGLSFALWLGCVMFSASLSAKILGSLIPAQNASQDTSKVIINAIAHIPMLAPIGGSVMIVVWILIGLLALRPVPRSSS